MLLWQTGGVRKSTLPGYFVRDMQLRSNEEPKGARVCEQKGERKREREKERERERRVGRRREPDTASLLCDHGGSLISITLQTELYVNQRGWPDGFARAV